MVVSYNDLFTQTEKEQIIDDYVNGATFSILQEKYNIHSKEFISKLLGDKKRTSYETSRMRNTTFKGKHHSEKTKQIMREKRLKFMKEHPDETAWRKRNEPSYPESCFISFLEQNQYDKNYLIEREYSIYPFYIDFAFVDEKLAIEIDGSQHLLEQRKQKDKEKDELLISLGWKVMRISEDVVKNDWSLLSTTLQNMLSDNLLPKTPVKVGIIKSPKTYEKVARGEDGLSDKQRMSSYRQRKVKNRPSKDELLELLPTYPLTTIGKMYGVSDNTIRHWLKSLGLPYRKKDFESEKTNDKEI